MAKWTAVGFGAENAEVDPETIESFYDEATHGIPPKGVYRGVAKRLKKGVTSESAANPGEPKMYFVCEIAEPKGTKKAIYNGYGMWYHKAINPEQANRINQMFTALLDGTKLTAAKRKAVIRAFWTGKVDIDENDFITKIGTWVVPEEIEVAFTTRADKFGGSNGLAIGNLLPISDAPKPKPSDSDEDEDDEDVDEEEVDDEDVEEEDDESEEDDEEEDEDEEPESSEEEDARYDELMALTRAQLVKLYKETIEGAKVLKSTKSEDMANAIVDAEFAESDDEEEEDEEEPEEDEEEEEPEEDEEEEEEPPAKSTRRRAAPAAKTRKVATPAPSGRGKARAGSSKAPAARRRSGKGDEPPF